MSKLEILDFSIAVDFSMMYIVVTKLHCNERVTHSATHTVGDEHPVIRHWLSGLGVTFTSQKCYWLIWTLLVLALLLLHSTTKVGAASKLSLGLILEQQIRIGSPVVSQPGLNEYRCYPEQKRLRDPPTSTCTSVNSMNLVLPICGWSKPHCNGLGLHRVLVRILKRMYPLLIFREAYDLRTLVEGFEVCIQL